MGTKVTKLLFADNVQIFQFRPKWNIGAGGREMGKEGQCRNSLKRTKMEQR